jgi:hypothetical protein
MKSSIEELVFELAEAHTSGELEKLIRLLDLVLNGKKNVEPSPQPPKATASKAKGGKAAAVESDDSAAEEPF